MKEPRARKSDYQYSTYANCTHARLLPSTLTSGATRDLGHSDTESVPIWFATGPDAENAIFTTEK